MEKHFVAEDCGVFLLRIDLKIYSLEALLKTAYWYTSKCFLHLQHSSSDQVEVRFKCRTDVQIANLPEQFINDLLDQTLRDKVARETEALRNLIVAHALSKTCLINIELETHDPFANEHPASTPQV
jgi:His-Xaa-Ser system protein HxsD